MTSHNTQTSTQLHAENEQLHQRIATLEQENATLKQTAETYRESEMHLRAIFESMTDHVLVWDRNYDYLYANQVAIDHVGTTRDQVIGKNIRDGLGHIPEFMHLWMGRIDEVFAANTQMRWEEISEVGEKTVYGEAVISPMRNADGEAIAVALVYRDVTHLKGVQDELRVFKTLVEHMSEGVAHSGVDTVFSYANPAYKALTGWGEELIGKTIFDIHQETPDELAAAAQEAIEKGNWQGPLTIKRPDGTLVPCAVSVVTLYDSQQQPQMLMAVIRDISEHKQLIDQLTMAQFALDAASDSVYLMDEEARIFYVNAATYNALGYRRDELLSMTIPDIDPNWNEEQYREGWKIWTQPGAGSFVFESHHRRKDGSVFPVEVADNFVEINGKGYLLAFVRDITERKQQAAEWAALQEQVIQAQRSALRELSTPLIPITNDVVIMPLIGTIDSQRAQQVMETLLEGAAHHRANLVILDITGVQVVDTQVAQAFIQAAQAVRLLGARVMLTGIQPQIAQTLVHLGIDLTDILTHGSLQSGIAAALRKTR